MGEGTGKALPHRLPAEARKGVGVGNSWLQSSETLTFADTELSDLRVQSLPAVGRHLFRTN